MSRGRPLALTDVQLQLVMTAAHALLPSTRTRFLGAVADQLTGLDEVSDVDVQVAVLRVIERLLPPAA